MLKRQREGTTVSDPALVEAMIQLLAATHPDQPASTWNLLRDAVHEGWQSVDRRLKQYGLLDPGRFSLREANERLVSNALPAREVSAMKFLVQVICVTEAAERRQQVFEIERDNLAMDGGFVRAAHSAAAAKESSRQQLAGKLG